MERGHISPDKKKRCVDWNESKTGREEREREREREKKESQKVWKCEIERSKDIEGKNAKKMGERWRWMEIDGSGRMERGDGVEGGGWGG